MQQPEVLHFLPLLVRFHTAEALPMGVIRPVGPDRRWLFVTYDMYFTWKLRTTNILELNAIDSRRPIPSRILHDVNTVIHRWMSLRAGAIDVLSTGGTVTFDGEMNFVNNSAGTSGGE